MFFHQSIFIYLYVLSALQAFVEFLAHGDIGNLTNDPAVTADPNPRVEMGTLEEGLVR